MPINRKIFFDSIRPQFNGAMSRGQVNGMNTLLNVWEQRYGHFDIALLAYCLATSFLETARTMQPVRETMAADDATAIRRLNAAYRKGRMPYVKSPYWRRDNNGRAWFGRGHVQLTHEGNYRTAAARLGLPLNTDPALAMNPETSARVLFSGCIDGWFTAHKLTDFINKSRCDFFNARKVVNPGDKKTYKLIESYANAFHTALKRAKTEAAPERPDARSNGAKVGGGIAAGGGAVIAAEPSLWPYVLAGVAIAVLVAFIIWKKRNT